MTLVSLDAVTYRYAGRDEPALRDVTLDVDEGEFVVVAGLSGSGKSTLVRVLSGLAPHAHGGTFGGRAVIAGMDTREHGPGSLAAAVGTLLQDPETQIVMGTVRAELAFPLENRGEPPGAVARGVEEVALALGIPHLLDRSTAELSGGELQRVALAAALAGHPRLVVLDEPTSQLDPVAGDELVWLLRRLNEEWGTTVVLVEHRLERCLAAADRVVAFESGAVAHDGPPEQFLRWALHHNPALSTPGATMFALANREERPVGVKAARRALGTSAPSAGGASGCRSAPEERGCAPDREATGTAATSARALKTKRLWFEVNEGKAVLRDIHLEVAPGERIAIMGRNGAGKSTLLRLIKGLNKPTRGRIDTQGPVALLLQNPGDLLFAERVADEGVPGFEDLADRHPRDLSGGERQRLALAVATGGAATPAVLCLDEPTRGMDRARKGELAAQIDAWAASGAAVLVATHDPEFAVAFADRVVLLGDGRVLADGPPSEILSGGWYFATEVARILRGAGGALTPEEGAEIITQRETVTA